MSKTTYKIPAEFQNQLRYAEAADTRTGDEVLATIDRHVPVTSEKNVWAYWHAGLKAMPKWCQHNVIDWVRILGPSWTVRILDTVPDSPNHALKFVQADTLPEAFVKATMEGPYIGPHSADFLRGACLYQYGGVFMDVGVLLIRHLERVCWKQLEDPSSPFQVSIPLMYGQTTANHFVAARKGDPFIKRWHELFVHLWKDHNSHEGLIENPLIAFGKEMNFDDARAGDFHWDFKVEAKTVMEYISQVLAWNRLCMLENAGDGFSCADYWRHNVLCFDVLKENWGAEVTIGFPQAGQKMLDLLSVSTEQDPSSEEYKKAHELAFRLLTKSSMQKITHAKNLTNDAQLGALWDEHEGRDSAPGTMAELLRYGTVHFEQVRESIEYMEAPAARVTMKKGVLEP